MARRAANSTRLTNFLRQHGLGYFRKETTPTPTSTTVWNEGDATKRATDAGALDVVEVDANSAVFNKVVVCTATSVRHARAVADDIARSMSDAVVRDRREPWVVVDGKSVVYHVLVEDERKRFRPEFVFSEDDPIRQEAEKQWAISDADDKRRR